MAPTGEKATDDTKKARSKSAPSGRQTAAVVRRARLEDEEWYVGMPFLTTDGEFAVRSSEKNGKCELVLVVRAGGKIKHGTLRWNPQSAHWSVQKGPNPKEFPSLHELVAFYATNDLELNGQLFRLQRPCAKPRWMVSRRDVAYSPRDKLGEGNFCVVYKGCWNRMRVAVKVASAAGEAEASRQAIAAHEGLVQEGQLLFEVRHPNLVQFYGMACEQPPVIVLLELCPGGSLLSLLRQWAPAISTAERVKFAVEAAQGMFYLHLKGIIHRDLAARNCLIGRHGAVKIADFGLSQVFKGEARVEDIGRKQLPVRWMGPESLQKRAEFSLKTDVWAFGVLLFEIFNDGGKPWPNEKNLQKIATRIRKGRMPGLPDRTPAAVADLVERRCWVLDAEARSTMVPVKEELEAIQLAHPYALKELAVNRIPGVRAMSLERIRAAQAECEDVERAAQTAAETPAEVSTGTTAARSRRSTRSSRSRSPSRRRSPSSRRSASRSPSDPFEENPQPTASNEPPQTSRESRKSARSGKSTPPLAAKPPQLDEK